MTRDEARQEIRRSWRQILPTMTDPAKTRVNGERTYICPLCGNGSGTDGDGLTYNPKSKDGNSLKCFKCGFSGDVIDLYQQTTGTNYNAALSLLADRLGLEVEPYREGGISHAQTAGGTGRSGEAGEAPQDALKDVRNGLQGLGGINIPPTGQSALESEIESVEGNVDYTAYYKKCRSRLQDPEAAAYLTGRGISLETAAACWLGYDPQADPAEAPGGHGEIRHPAPRIIIPTTKSYYVGRAIDPNTPGKYTKLNVRGGKPGIFNSKALYADEAQEAEVFVTEGVFDALSVIEAGAAAIAINSAANTGLLVRKLKQKHTDATLILCLDNDPAGQQATKTLREDLRKIGVSFITADICEGYGDPNDYLQADKEGFTAAVQEAKRRTRTAAKPDNVSYYIETVMSDDMEAFSHDVPTGFPNLDGKSGGLHTGLYVLAATSSLGKTTFIHQVGDQIAAAGIDVLYFSLEMSRLEMASKSLARITAQHDLSTAVTSLEIRKRYLPKNVLDASEEYRKTVGDRMSIVEGNFSCNVTFIGDYVRRFCEKNETKPVVILDYLQIVQPEEISGRPQSTKEAVDATITQLKRLSREISIPIIVISSVNRTNYLTPIDFESLKESGGIEYTADVVWGLQLHVLSDESFEAEKSIVKKRERIKQEKERNPRMIDLVCLKNRFGISSYKCSFEYYSANDLFIPVADFSENEMPKKANHRIGG